MGIKGLSRLVSSNDESMFKPLKLQNSYLVMDGNNIKNRLYSSLCSSKFGGDYDVYYKGLKNLFLNFKKCNITPIVVWDGVSEPKKRHLRMRDYGMKVKKLIDIQCSETNDVFPILNKNVFFTVLDELEIMHVTCLYEADKEAAIIANILQCPVLSNDSDFCCFNVPFIFVNKMDFQMKEDQTLGPGPEYYFDCWIFDRKAFMKQYGLTQDLFLLVPVLLGDHSEQYIFDSFLKRIIGITAFEPYMERLKKLLMWIGEVGPSEPSYEVDSYPKVNQEVFQGKKKKKKKDCYLMNLSYHGPMGLILADTEQCDKERVLGVIKNVFEYYKALDKPISPYIKINRTELKIEIDDDIEWEMLPKDHMLTRYPKYVINSYIKHIIPSVFIKVASEEAVIYASLQWEDVDECATALISMPILSGSLQIMKRVLGEDITKTIVLRQGKRYQEVLMYNSENFLTGITREIFTAEEDERKQVLFQVVDFGESEKRFVNKFGRDWSIFTVAVMYWMKNRGRYLRCKNFEKRKVHSVVMTALACHAECVKNGNPLGSSFLNDIPDSELSHFGEKLQELGKGEPGIEYSFSIIHDFALLQACINAIISLNQILNTPFPNIQIYKFFTGRIAHDLCQLMEDPNYADTILMATPTIRDLYYRFIRNIRMATDQDDMFD